MSHWDSIRRRARARRAEVDRLAGVDCSARAVLEAAGHLTGLTRVALPSGDALLFGADAVLDPGAATIWFNRELDPRLSLFYQAHEYAHLWLHSGLSTTCDQQDVDPEAAEEPVSLGVQRVEGYGPHERREREANVFATEFLLPTHLLRKWYAEEGLDAAAIVARVGLPAQMVLHQLARALLTPETMAPGPADEPAPSDPAPDLRLDPSQAAAAHATRGPLLLEAGPGTGKTRTLVGRVLHLLAQGADPRSILALTFSNKAAEEMRERVARVVPDAVPHIWMGTFHAFGLELLRKYGTRLGLPPKPVVLDQIDALLVLERLLPELQLDHYANLYEPTLYLKDLLGAISRAKDELAGPERYHELVKAMRDRAELAEEVQATEKALEVARVYGRYQAHLDAEGLLDFGDLIKKAVELLRRYGDVRRLLRERYRHVLVDEYQDVNRASGLLLKELAGAGGGLWVVGDARQAIYRFRGAAPVNMRLFPRDFPGATVHELRHNYRSQPPVVELFSELAPRMRASGKARPTESGFQAWRPVRAHDGGRVSLHVAENGDAEGDGIAREIQRHRAAGIPYCDQAVLCRSHTQLARVAARLERAGVPMLYLGDLFEREEVRDLLALVSLACEGDGRGLVRVARFPEYAIPLADVRALLALTREREVAFPEALGLGTASDDLSAVGRAGLARLAQHLDGLCGHETDAWTFLARYLFERSDYLRDLVQDDSVGAQQRRLALYQLLQVARGAPRGEAGDDPKRRFLQHVRRLEMFGEEQSLRQIPEWASTIDAVRLMTVHASKGLEFRAVYLPGLNTGSFPSKCRWQPCPPPMGLITRVDGDGSQESDHDVEEECLFFVALSRARDMLCLSRAQRHGRTRPGPSTLLQHIAQRLPHPPNGPVTWPSNDSAPDCDPELAVPQGSKPVYTAEMLDLYRKCGRRFYYEHVLGLGGKREDSAYVQFHRCVYAVLRWLRQERSARRAPDVAAALARLAEAWSTDGPRDHVYEAEYRRVAESMVARAVDRAGAVRGRIVQPRWELALAHGRVRLQPDEVEERDDGSIVARRLRTGRPSMSELKRDIYALYQATAEQEYPRAARSVEVLYLSCDVVEEVRLSTKTMTTRLGHYDAAIAGIRRGEFPAQPNDRDCPRCPHYFICPAGDDV